MVVSTTGGEAMQNLDIGGVLSRVFTTYRDQAGVLLPAAFVVFLVIAVLSALLVAGLASAGGLIGLIVGVLVGWLLFLLGTLLLQGVVAELVRDVQDGRRDFSIGQLFQSAAPALPSVFAASLLLILLIGVPAVVLSLLIPVIGILLAIVLALAVAVVFAPLVPILVLERPGVMPGLRRSRELTSGKELQILAVIVVVALIVAVAGAIIGAIVGAIATGAIANGVAQLISNTLFAPLWALAGPVLYFALRVIKEGAGAAGPAGEPGSVARPPGASGSP
jgi:NADH:ubiquinone oxidoreductase subunit 6 (subunit J)